MTKLVGIKTPNKKPVAEVVTALEELLEMAKSGDLREFAWCGIKVGSKPVWDYVGEVMNIEIMYTNLTHLTNRYYLDVFVEDNDD